MSADWSEYYDAVEGKPLNPFFMILEPHLPAGGHAIDLGCGSGRGTEWLLKRGFTVHAIDSEPEGLARLHERLGDPPGLTLSRSAFETAELEPSDLVLSVFSLFFTKPEDFGSVWANIMASVRLGGLFAGQLLGPGDDWADGTLSVHNRSEVESLLSGWDVLHWEEAQRDGHTAMGKPKMWHVHHIIARRK